MSDNLMAKYPLAHKSGIELLHNVLAATQVWRSLTKPQRELLLSAVAGFPVAARYDVRKRLMARGLISPVTFVGGPKATAAGRFVVAWRTP